MLTNTGTESGVSMAHTCHKSMSNGSAFVCVQCVLCQRALPKSFITSAWPFYIRMNLALVENFRIYSKLGIRRYIYAIRISVEWGDIFVYHKHSRRGWIEHHERKTHESWSKMLIQRWAAFRLLVLSLSPLDCIRPSHTWKPIPFFVKTLTTTNSNNKRQQQRA